MWSKNNRVNRLDMSKTRQVIRYDCDCGEEYGSCDKVSAILYEYNCSCDIASIVHRVHIGSDDESYQYIGTFTDKGLETLRKILSTNDTDTWTDADHKAMTNGRGW